MKFYLCQTNDGARLAGTQADAKALDKNFETVEWATDKDALMERFNSLFSKVNSITTRESVHTGVIEEDNFDHISAIKPPVNRPKVGEIDWQSAPEPGDCKRCIGMSVASRSVETIMSATNIEWALHAADARFLDRVENAIAERRKELR